MKNIRPNNKDLPGASLESHRHAWNYVAKEYAGGAALPAWGPSGELKDEKIITTIRDKSFLEIGFGSGDSIIYLLRNGAKHVTGIDFSPAQLQIARKRINKAFRGNKNYLNKVTLLLQSMDERLPNEKFDSVIALYSIGWSEQPEELSKKIYHKLKAGGYFYFSWDHYISRIIEDGDMGIHITKNYHEPMPLVRENWKGSGSIIETHQLRPSDWFHMLIRVGYIVDGFWEPKPDKNTKSLKICSANYTPSINEKIPNCVVFRAKKV